MPAHSSQQGGLNGAPVRNSRDWTDRGEKSHHSRERKPQGLKPASFWGCYGTTESRAPSRFVAGSEKAALHSE